MPHGDEGQFWRVIRGHAERDACGRYYQRYSLGATGSPSTHRRRQSINQSIMLFRVVQVTKSLQDPLEVGNSLLGISDNVRE